MLNAFTIDLEDYWSVFSRDWLGKDAEPNSVVIRNTQWFLETLERFDVKATFFVLGEVAEKFPDLVRKVSRAGHEIASHGLYHRQIRLQKVEEFRQEVRISRRMLEDIAMKPVVGYRAAAFSVTPATSWAFEVLAEEGYKYDSSVFPIAARRYGWPGFARSICQVKLKSGLQIIEAPLASLRLFGKDWPVGGGGYLRHYPWLLTSAALRQIQRTRPFVVYVHPYEIDVEQASVESEGLTEEKKNAAVKHHRMQMRNRHTVKDKVTKLLREFEFSSLVNVIDKTVAMPYQI